MATPYLTSPGLVQCEVTLPGTPYSHIVYNQFQIKQSDNIPTMATMDSGGKSLSFCGCFIIVMFLLQ